VCLVRADSISSLTRSSAHCLDASVEKGEHLVNAAIARLARGDGRGSPINLGIDRSEVIRDAKVGNGVIYTHFKRRGRGDAVRGLVDEVLERLLEEQLRLRRETTTTYHDRAELAAEGAGRRAIMKALLDDLSLYGAVADADDLTRARERVYYLAVALCDASVSAGSQPISPEDEPSPDLRFRRHLMEMHIGHREALRDVYRGFLAAASRVPVHDVERIDLVLSTFLEGAVLVRRIAHGHASLTGGASDLSGEEITLNDDELVDAVLRIFIAMSQPAAGVDSETDAVLFGREGPPTATATAETVVYRDRGDMYATILETIDQLSSEETVSHCALHTSGTRQSRAVESEAFKKAVSGFLERGGQVRNLEKVGSLTELDRTVERLTSNLDSGHKMTFRALVMDSPPSLSPLILGDRVAFLGREDDGLIVDAIAFVDEVGRKWCETHYETQWHDEHAYTLATPNGLNLVGIDDAARRLEVLERQRARGLRVPGKDAPKP
jgi:hypothetical protein